MSRGAVTVGIHIFGVRHHGPGCARSLRAALEKLEPDIVLVEGPPDAQEALPWLVSEEMQPPVALLIYAPDNPQHAVFYPFTHFSPEWQALRYALKRGIPARFMDLPQAFQLAKEQTSDHAGEAEETPQEEEAPLNEGANSVVTPARGAGGSQSSTQTPGAATETEEPANPRDDPFALLAQAAGYDDHELWWERQIELRRDVTGLFEGILEAMTALRIDKRPKEEHEAQREAHMRQAIRAAQAEGFQRIAVVCGAWHAPALSDPGDAKTDAAHLLREKGLDASSASVIEAVRLSEALAALRDLPMPGLAELHEAIQTVLCNGNAEIGRASCR